MSRIAFRSLARSASVLFLIAPALVATLCPLVAVADDPTPIADVQHEGPVNFEKEILPILQRNCLACHSGAKAESELVLETPATILKGGSEGPGVVPGNAEESLVLQLAARQRESFMPPDDNNVGAKPLTSEELGLIKLWIQQGATGDVSSGLAKIQWQPLPPGVNPIYAAALSADGRFAAAGRANQIFVYHVPSQRELGRLTDPSLLESGIYTQPGVADLDLIQSLAFSPDGQRLVSGGFRTAKIWRRQHNVRLAELAGLESPPSSIASSTDGQWLAIGEQSGVIRLWNVAQQQLSVTLSGHTAAVTGLQFSPAADALYSVSADQSVRGWRLDGTALFNVAAPAPLHALALIEEGKRLATGGADNVIRLWSLTPGADPAAAWTVAQQAELAGHSQAITSLVAVGAGQLLSGSLDGTMRLWQTADGQQLREHAHGGPITSIDVRPDGAWFASASSDHKSVKIWNAADGQQLQELRGDFRVRQIEAGQTRYVALAQKLIDLANADLKAGTERKTAEEANVTKAKEEQTKAEEELAKKVEAAKQPLAEKEAADKALSDAKAAVAALEEAKKKAEEAAVAATEQAKAAEAKRAEAEVAAQTAATVQADAQAKADQAKQAADADPNNQDLVTAAAEAAQAAAEAAEKSQQAADAHTEAQTALKAAQDNAAALAEAQKKAKADLADAMAKATQAEEAAKKADEPAKKAMEEQTAAERAAEAAQRATQRAEETLQKAVEALGPLEAAVKTATEHHAQSQNELATAQQAVSDAERPWTGVAFAADNATLAAADAQGTIFVFDGASGSPLEVIDSVGPAPVAIDFLPDSHLAAAGQGTTVGIYSTQPQWALERTIGSPDTTDAFVDRVTAVDISPDGQVLATGTGEPSRSGEIALWNLETGELLRKIPDAHSDTVFAIDFARDGQRLVSCAADRFVKIFRTADGQFERAFEGHTHHVLGVAWSADGRTISSSGADKVIKVWNAITGDQQRTIAGFNKEVTAIRFLGDSEEVVASSGDTTVQSKRTNDGGNIRSFGGGTDFMYAVDVSADGQVIVAGGQDSVLRAWAPDGKELGKWAPPASQ